MHSSSTCVVHSTAAACAIVLPVSLCYGMAVLLETSVHPFDVLEAEPELVSGYYVDYGGYVFMVIYLAEGVALTDTLTLSIGRTCHHMV